jgi:hypothetical protein
MGIFPGNDERTVSDLLEGIRLAGVAPSWSWIRLCESPCVCPSRDDFMFGPVGVVPRDTELIRHLRRAFSYQLFSEGLFVVLMSHLAEGTSRWGGGSIFSRPLPYP